MRHSAGMQYLVARLLRNYLRSQAVHFTYGAQPRSLQKRAMLTTIHLDKLKETPTNTIHSIHIHNRQGNKHIIHCADTQTQMKRPPTNTIHSTYRQGNRQTRSTHTLRVWSPSPFFLSTWQAVAKSRVSCTVRLAMCSSYWSTRPAVLWMTNSFLSLPLYLMSPVMRQKAVFLK